MDDITKKWLDGLNNGYIFEEQNKSDKEIYVDLKKVYDKIWEIFSTLNYLNHMKVNDEKSKLIFELGRTFSKLSSELNKLIKQFE